MKITKDLLKQLIKEELNEASDEDVDVYVNPKEVVPAIAYLIKERRRHRKRIEALELKVKQLFDFNQKMRSGTAATFDPADVDKILKREKDRARKDVDFLKRATGKNLEREE